MSGQDDPDRPPAESRRGLRPTVARVVIWVVVGALALFLIVNGLIGVVQKGG